MHLEKITLTNFKNYASQTFVFGERLNAFVAKHHVNISGGPLAYRYQFEEIYVHYGTENHQGSEHRIHGHAFPAEVSYQWIFDLFLI